MNVKHTKKPEQRIDIRYLSSLGIKTFGDTNLYPQQIRDIVKASPTGRTCVERRATYIEGNGLSSQALSEWTCNDFGGTVDDIHSLCADDIAYHEGFALHVNYNILGQIVSVSHVPFENCRLEEEDENGVISHIVLHPDWRGKKTRGGRAIKVDANTIDRLPVFNPDPNIVQLQITTAGGIEFYKGQILYASRAGYTTYPTPSYDSVLTDMSTDEGLSNVNNRNARNNFLPGGMIATRKGQDEDDDGGFSESLEKAQGDTNALKIIQVQLETDEDMPVFIPFKSANFDKEFTETAKAVIGNIYAAFNQEMFCRLRSGSLGFSGEIAESVKIEYCQQVAKSQRMLSRIYKTVFEHWSPDEGLPYADFADVQIEPLADIAGTQSVQAIPPDVLKDLTVNERRGLVGFTEIGATQNDKQLLAEKLGVGGTQSLVSIIADVTMDEATKRGLLSTLFGLTADQINSIFPDGTQTPA